MGGLRLFRLLGRSLVSFKILKQLGGSNLGFAFRRKLLSAKDIRRGGSPLRLNRFGRSEQLVRSPLRR
jgi:hypothetical protein